MIGIRPFPDSKEQPGDAVHCDVGQHGGRVSDRGQAASFGRRVRLKGLQKKIFIAIVNYLVIVVHSLMYMYKL